MRIWIKITVEWNRHLDKAFQVSSHHLRTIISKELQQAKNFITMMIRPAHYHLLEWLRQHNCKKQEKEFYTEVKMDYQWIKLPTMRNSSHAILGKQRKILLLKTSVSMKIITNQKGCTIMNNISSWKANISMVTSKRVTNMIMVKTWMSLESWRSLQEILQNKRGPLIKCQLIKEKNKVPVHSHMLIC